MEKYETLDNLITHLSLTPEAIVDHWISEKRLSADFLQQKTKQVKKLPTIIPAKKFVTPKTIAPGMFRYADGLIFPEVIPGIFISSIIAYAEKNHGFSWGLQRKKLPWSSCNLRNGKTEPSAHGYKATQDILQIALMRSQPAEAAQWCSLYNYDCNERGSGFLNSVSELKKAVANKNAINAAYSVLMLPELPRILLSATEASEYTAWRMYLYSGNKHAGDKFYPVPVYCAFLF